ncbi:MAG: GNAT family protein [Bacteroidota bacterium]
MLKDFPTLKTSRLILDKIIATDIPNIVQFAGDKKISQTTLNIPYPYNEEDAIFWINLANQGFKGETRYIFAIRLALNNEFIGGISLGIERRFDRAELGYWLAVPFWNKGFMSEAAKRIVKFGFEVLNLNKILSTHIVENPASGKVMINCGMVKEGELRQHVKKEEKYFDLIQYSITKSEYHSKSNN